jgi:FkbM family methyltransferase
MQIVKARTLARRLKRRATRLFRGSADDYLKSCSGIIHVGANTGQERGLYAHHGLSVVWIEPLAPQFEELKANIRGLAGQLAINALITDRDGDEHVFHVASNDGKSSSILDLHMHKDVWPDIGYVNHVPMVSRTLPTVLQAAGIPVERYDVLVLDTQGSELLVLQGAAPILHQFKYIKAEAADFEAYKNCATVPQIRSYLEQHGFRLFRSYEFARRRGGGRYFDLLFQRARLF